jgi:hypothetical protein
LFIDGSLFLSIDIFATEGWKLSARESKPEATASLEVYSGNFSAQRKNLSFRHAPMRCNKTSGVALASPW